MTDKELAKLLLDYLTDKTGVNPEICHAREMGHPFSPGTIVYDGYIATEHFAKWLNGKITEARSSSRA